MLLELSLLGGALRVLLSIEMKTDLGKSFHEANFLMVLISDDNLLGAQMRDARVTRLLIHKIRYVQGTKLVKLTKSSVTVLLKY